MTEQVHVPQEITLNICSYSTPKELTSNVALISQQWSQCCQMDLLWHPLYLRQFQTRDASTLIQQLFPLDRTLPRWKQRFAYKYQLERNWYFSPKAVTVLRLTDSTDFSVGNIHMTRMGIRSQQMSIFYTKHNSIYHSILDLNMKSEKHELELPVQHIMTGHRSVIWELDYNVKRFGNRLISVGQESSLYLWDVTNGSLITKLDNCHPQCIWNAKILNNTSVVTVGSDTQVKVSDVNRADPLRVYDEHSSVIYDVDCDQEDINSNFIVSGSPDRSLRVFDIRSDSPNSVMKATNLKEIYEVEASQMLHKNIILAGTSDGQIITLDVRKFSDQSNDTAIVSFFPMFHSCAVRGLSYDGRCLVAGSKYGVAIATNDSSVSIEFTGKELRYLDKKHVDVINQKQRNESQPYRVSQFLETKDEDTSIAVDEEILMVGSLSGNIRCYDFRPTVSTTHNGSQSSSSQPPLGQLLAPKQTTCNLQ